MFQNPSHNEKASPVNASKHIREKEHLTQTTAHNRKQGARHKSSDDANIQKVRVESYEEAVLPLRRRGLSTTMKRGGGRCR